MDQNPKDYKTKAKTIKHPRENKGDNLSKFALGEHFLNCF
jgi:hypothetical protein